jgi:hypothetical protein
VGLAHDLARRKALVSAELNLQVFLPDGWLVNEIVYKHFAVCLAMVTCAMALAANVTNYEGESESNQNVCFNFSMLSALLIASAATSMDSLSL